MLCFNFESQAGALVLAVSSPVTVAIVDTGISSERLEKATVLTGINLSREGNEDDTTDAGTHGTAVAETILSFAPCVKLVPIRLMNRWGTVQSRKKVEEAFDWILQNRDALDIQIVCVAFADFSHATSDALHRGRRLQQQILTLQTMNVMTVAPAGNAYETFRKRSAQGMAWPAIIREVVSVGEVEPQAGKLWLTARTQRLHANSKTGCQTTMFSTPGQLGSTSGAAACVVGRMAALIQETSLSTQSEIISSLMNSRQMALDENGQRWPSVD